MALFGGGGGKSFDTGALAAILEQGLRKRRDTLEEGFAKTPELSRKFEQKQGQLGEQFVESSGQRARDFGAKLQQVESPEFVRQEQAKAQELAFRNLPAVQQQIRENLAATGGLQRGAAISALSAPVLQAQQQAADTQFGIQQQAAGRNIARKEQALDTIFQTDQGSALTKLGIDRNTASVLLNTGREDILNRAMQLADIEQQRTQGLLDIEQLRQQQEIAKDQAKRAQFGQMLGGLGSLGGTGLGMFLGGPMGGAIGGQLGGQLGGFAGAGTPPDLSSALTMMALRRQNATPQRSTVQDLRQQAPFPGRDARDLR